MITDYIDDYEMQEQNRLNNSCHYTAKSKSVAKKITKIIGEVNKMELNHFIKQGVIAKLIHSHNNVLVKKVSTNSK